uniref:Uncharacterized protein n=1 Tax=Cucumis sativus TaxID=3659 RepID=A0A0A0LEN1_CUCSA
MEGVADDGCQARGQCHDHGICPDVTAWWLKDCTGGAVVSSAKWPCTGSWALRLWVPNNHVRNSINISMLCAFSHAKPFNRHVSGSHNHGDGTWQSSDGVFYKNLNEITSHNFSKRVIGIHVLLHNLDFNFGSPWNVGANHAPPGRNL